MRHFRSVVLGGAPLVAFALVLVATTIDAGALDCDFSPGEPNGTRATATPIGCNTTTCDTAIATLGDVDFYALEATAGDVVSLDLDRPSGNPAPALDSVLGVFDGAGNRLFVNDDGGAPGETRGPLSFLEFVAPYTGTFYIGVSAWDDLDFDGSSDTSTPANLTTGEYVLAVACTTVAPNAIVPIPWDTRDAGISAADNRAITYTLPFAFPYFGRTITRLSANTNGLIELLEAGESCRECADFATHFDQDHIAKNIDAIFAANDDLVTSVIIEGFPDRAEISWIGHTAADAALVNGEPLAFCVILFADGRVQWKFFEMAWVQNGADLFSGLYDEVQSVEREIPGGSRGFTGLHVDRAFEFDPTSKTIAAIPWDAHDASIAATGDGHTHYTLPFTFAWFGRAITALDVDTNGLVELLENGEPCSECGMPLTHFSGRHAAGDLDAVFVANDDLQTEVVIRGAPDLVTILWIGSTRLDGNFVEHPIAIEALLFRDGRVRWKLYDLNVATIEGDLFSGIYDGTRDVELEVFDGSRAFNDSALDRALEFPGGAEGPPGGGRCADGFDNDGDDLVDADDPDCHGCGDGVPDPGEPCDDGNATNGDGCDTNCTVSTCGNGAVGVDEQCDPTAAPTGCVLHEVCRPPASAGACICVARLDHFLGYETAATKGSLCSAGAPQHAGGACSGEVDCGGTDDVTHWCAANKLPKNVSVALSDALGTATYLVQKPVALAVPAAVNDGDVGDTAARLRGYRIKAAAKRCVAPAPQNGGRACRREPDCGGTKRVTSFCVTQPETTSARGVAVTNLLHPYGELIIDTGTLDRLLVPSATSLAAPADALDPAAHALEHFACAKVKPSKNAAKFPRGVQASVADALGPAVVYDVKKPTRLCVPAGVNGAAIENATTSLLCYHVKPARGETSHGAVTGIYATSTLARERLNVVGADELCLRSTTTLP
jgi:cysteine-rich repeat protein